MACGVGPQNQEIEYPKPVDLLHSPCFISKYVYAFPVIGRYVPGSRSARCDSSGTIDSFRQVGTSLFAFIDKFKDEYLF